MPESPAFVHDRAGTILAGNAVAAWLLGGLDGRPSWPHLVFVDGPFRRMVDERDWEALARRHAASLRLSLSRYQGDPALTAVVASLHAASPDFVRLWSAHEVADWTGVTCRLHHPEVGEVKVVVDVLKPTAEPGQWLVTFAIEPGSPSQAALRRLALRCRTWAWSTATAAPEP